MILPGEEGKITLGFKTNGYGGKIMKKTTRVNTNDTTNLSFNLIVTGKVEKVVNIEPEYVYMAGKTGQTLESFVRITPFDKYKFSITGLTQKMNAGIKAFIQAPKKNKKTWNIRITANSYKPIKLHDVLIFSTDSEYMPDLEVKVYATFH